MLNKENLLRRNGLDVFKHYVPGAWRIGRNFLNPLYEDHRASCNIYFDRRSVCYRMKDFGNDNYSGDCFYVVGKLRGLDCRNARDFIEILRVIDRDLHLGLDDHWDTATCTWKTPGPSASSIVGTPAASLSCGPQSGAEQKNWQVLETDTSSM